MSQPTPFSITSSFAGDEANGVSGRSTVKTASLDGLMVGIKSTTDQIITNLALIQRDDTKLFDGVVELHTLSSSVRLLIATAGTNPRGGWVTATAYAIKDVVTQGTGTYLCAAAHTSGVFATDLAAGKWIVLFDTASYVASGIVFTPTGTIAGTNLQVALAEVASEALQKAGNLSDVASFTAALANLIAGATAETDPAADDLVGIKDVSAGATGGRQMTVANLLKAVNDLNEDTLPDTSNDYLLIYDVSGNEAKKAKIATAIPSGTQFLKDRFNLGISLIKTLQKSAAAFQKIIDGWVDAFQDATGVDAVSSLNETFDSARTAYVPSRSGSSTAVSDAFDSIASWTNTSTGTGGAVVVADPDPDVNVGNVVKLTTGATPGGIGRIQKDIGSIPASFGVMFLVKLNTVGSVAGDSMVLQFENSAVKNLICRLRDNSFEIFQDGAYRTIIAHGGAFYTEWWVQVTDVGAGNHQVDVYAGTEFTGTRTGALPAGVGINGQVVIEQDSGTTANRESRVALMQIGTSQLPDNLTLISNAITAEAQPSKARIAILSENISNGIVPNTNLIAKVSRDGGTTYTTAVLVDRGVYGAGEVDSSKDVNILTAEIDISTQPAGTSMRWRIESTGGKYHAVQGVHMEWE